MGGKGVVLRAGFCVTGGIGLLISILPVPVAAAWIFGLIGAGGLIADSFFGSWRNGMAMKAMCEPDYQERYWNLLSQKDMVQVLLSEHLEKQKERIRKPASRLTLRRRVIYSAVALLLLLVFLCGFYTKRQCAPLLCFLITGYAMLWNWADPIRLLYKKAKRHPKVPFDRLVAESTYDASVSHKGTIFGMIGGAVLALILMIFFAGTSETKMDFVRVDGGMMLESYSPALTEMDRVVIPEKVDGQPVVAIGEDVFSGCAYLEQIVIPETVHTIGSGAFRGCVSMEAIELPTLLTALGGEAFQECWSLKAIRIPSGLTALRGSTFEGCSELEHVELHNGITAIHAYCFRGCKSLEEIRLPTFITEIRTYTFEGCSSLRRIEIPYGVTRIASHAFENCSSLYEVKLPNGLQQIGSSAFRSCTALDYIELPSGVDMESNAFKESGTKIEYR